MALPLLLLAGAGILGGGQFLLKKMDDRRKQSLFDGFQQQLQGTGQMQDPMAQAALGQAQRMVDDGSFLERNSGQLENLINNYGYAQAQAQAAEQNRLAQMQDAYSQTNIGIAQDLQTRYNSELSEFAETQTQFRAAMNALENPSNLNSVTTLYNLFNILEPGGRVTANEDGTFTGIGDSGNQFANWLNQMTGEGLTQDTIKEITESIWQQYAPRLERARAVKGWYEGEMQALSGAGRNVRSPVGSLGVDWRLNQYPSPDPGAVTDNEGNEYEVLR